MGASDWKVSNWSRYALLLDLVSAVVLVKKGFFSQLDPHPLTIVHTFIFYWVYAVEATTGSRKFIFLYGKKFSICILSLGKQKTT